MYRLCLCYVNHNVHVCALRIAVVEGRAERRQRSHMTVLHTCIINLGYACAERVGFLCLFVGLSVGLSVDTLDLRPSLTSLRIMLMAFLPYCKSNLTVAAPSKTRGRVRIP